MDFTIAIPDYLSINQLKQIQSYDHLSELDRMIKILSIVSDKTEDTIRELPPTNILEIYSDVITNLLDVRNQFFPIFELNGVKYGFKSLAKMSLGEYVDLEMLAKKPMDNIEDIMAILYRPITKNNFNSFRWALEHGISVAKGKVEDIFKFYDIEKYDTEKRFDNAESLKDMPAGFALGALSFFFASRSSLLKKHKDIFPEKPIETGDDEDSEGDNFSKHWGWFATLHFLSKSSILNFTGDKTITDLKVPFVFNFLSFERDRNLQEQKEIKRQQQKSYKVR